MRHQIKKRGDLIRIKAIGKPASEGFEQHYDRLSGLYAGRVETVNDWGLAYRAYPSTLATGRLFKTLPEALDYLEQKDGINNDKLRTIQTTA